VIVGFSWFVATFPGEGQSRVLGIPNVAQNSEGEKVIL